MRSLAAALALGVTLACDRSGAPVQPEPLTDCTILGVTVPRTVEVGETRKLSAFLEHCRPMYSPLASVAWKSLDSGLASVSGDTLTAIAPGAAIVQCTFGRITQQSVVVVQGASQQPGAPALRMYGCRSWPSTSARSLGAFVIGTNGTVTHVSSSAVWGIVGPGRRSARGIVVQYLPGGTDVFSQGRTRVTASYQGMAAAMSVQVAGQVSSQ